MLTEPAAPMLFSPAADAAMVGACAVLQVLPIAVLLGCATEGSALPNGGSASEHSHGTLPQCGHKQRNSTWTFASVCLFSGMLG